MWYSNLLFQQISLLKTGLSDFNYFGMMTSYCPYKSTVCTVRAKSLKE